MQAISHGELQGDVDNYCCSAAKMDSPGIMTGSCQMPQTRKPTARFTHGVPFETAGRSVTQTLFDVAWHPVSSEQQQR